MFRYTSEMVRLGTTGRRHGARAAALAAGLLLPLLALTLLAAALLPAAAPASPSVDDLQSQARSVRREVARLDGRAEVLTEKYNVARATLDAVNIRLQEARRDLERARVELDAAQAMRGDRLAAMYKSDGYSVLDVIFNLSDIGEAGTQLGYFRSIDEADQDTVTRISAMEQQVVQARAADRRGQGGRAGPRDGAARAAGGHRGRAGGARAAPDGPRRARQEAALGAGPAGRGGLGAPGRRPPAWTSRPSTAPRRRSPSSRRR